MKKTRKITLSLSLLLVFVLLCSVLVTPVLSNNNVTADAATNYYSGITATNGQALLGQLHDLITTTHKKYTSYVDCKTPSKVEQTDGSSSGKIWAFYSRVEISSAWDGGSTWNREHVWPQSLSNGLWGESGGGSDMHHIRPTISNINSTRGNNKFAELTNGNAVKYGSKVVGWTGSSCFEPLDEVKGDVARIVMYVYTHYNQYYNVGGTTNGSGGSFGTLKFANVVSGSEDNAIALMLAWNKQDPVDAIERKRNDAVYAVQGNRNPFIDNESYADAIWGKTAVTPPTSITVSASKTTLDVADTATLSVAVQPTNASKSVTWSSSNSNIVSVNSSGVVTAVGAGTAVITATSTANSSIKGTITLTVNEPAKLTAINVTGTPTTTTYSAGQKFNPAGLVVTATYDDGTSKNVTSLCQWVDGVTGQATLSQGTTTVLCKYGSFSKEVTGITVNKAVEPTTKTISISRDDFVGEGAYAWCTATPNNVSISAFMYGGNKTNIQMNSNKTSYYIFNGTALPGEIVSITIKTTTEKSWQLLTSSTAFSQGSGLATGGTSHGTKTANDLGATWEINSNDTFFALNYVDSGAVYVMEIIIVYSTGQGETSCTHANTSWQTTIDPTCTAAGTKQHKCTDCGEVLQTASINALGHSWSNWAPMTGQQGVETRSCSGCGEVEYRTVSTECTHNWSSWAPVAGQPTKESRTCSLCGEVEYRTVSTECTHNWSSWAPVAGQPTKESRTCSLCGEVEYRTVSTECVHNWSEWKYDGETTQTRSCTLCGETQQREAIAKYSDLDAAMQKIEEAKTLEEKFAALKEASRAIKRYTQSELEQYDLSAYTTALEEYNSNIIGLEADITAAKATSSKLVSVVKVAATLSLLAALAYVGKFGA